MGMKYQTLEIPREEVSLHILKRMTEEPSVYKLKLHRGDSTLFVTLTSEYGTVVAQLKRRGKEGIEELSINDVTALCYEIMVNDL